MNFISHLRNFLNRTTIRSLLLVREKELLIWAFMNLYLTLHKIHGSIWQLNFVSLPSLCKLSCKQNFDLFEKKSFNETVFSFLKSSQFCTITSTLRWICLQTRLMYNFRFPVWKKIHDQHLIGEMSRLTIKGNIWYIHDFLEALGNNIRVLFLIFDYTDYLMLLLSVFDISIIICFL